MRWVVWLGNSAFGESPLHPSVWEIWKHSVLCLSVQYSGEAFALHSPFSRLTNDAIQHLHKLSNFSLTVVVYQAHPDYPIHCVKTKNFFDQPIAVE